MRLGWMLRFSVKLLVLLVAGGRNERKVTLPYRVRVSDAAA